ncbi:MAG: hypothetical protein MIO93_01485 [ANME-2 cluster archaeon]|nr:hypothetical protein [ANME-2 cluster archaeon]
MISENRDILVERLEHKLVAKEREISELNDSLKESIIAELREGMKEDLDFDKRISAIESKVRDIGLSFDGVMKELLDQKTIIQDLKKKYLKKDVENSAQPVDQPDKTNSLSNWYESAQKTKKQNVPEQNAGPKSQYIIAESEDTRVPEKDISKEKGNKAIIIAENTTSRSSRKNGIIVEAREDEDVVIEYKK